MPTWVYYVITFVAGYAACAAAFLFGALMAGEGKCKD